MLTRVFFRVITQDLLHAPAYMIANESTVIDVPAGETPYDELRRQLELPESYYLCVDSWEPEKYLTPEGGDAAER